VNKAFKGIQGTTNVLKETSDAGTGEARRKNQNHGNEQL
jgi:hypothetical protein